LLNTSKKATSFVEQLTLRKYFIGDDLPFRKEALLQNLTKYIQQGNPIFPYSFTEMLAYFRSCSVQWLSQQEWKLHTAKWPIHVYHIYRSHSLAEGSHSGPDAW